jgi:hypothetical protein
MKHKIIQIGWALLGGLGLIVVALALTGGSAQALPTSTFTVINTLDSRSLPSRLRQ